VTAGDETTELALQAERLTDPSPETCDPVAEEVEDVDFEELTTDKQVLVLRDVLGEALQANALLEQRIGVVEGILFRILDAAEKAEVKSRIEVAPAMAIPGKHAAHKTRNSR
jgi:hypothetical protein